MENEKNLNVGEETSSDTPTPGAPVVAPRDIIAERLAARNKQNVSRPDSTREPEVDIPATTATVAESSPITNEEPLLPFDQPEPAKPVVQVLELKKLNAILAEATEELQTAAPDPVQKKPRPQRRERHDRNDAGKRDRHRDEPSADAIIDLSPKAEPILKSELSAKTEPKLDLKPRNSLTFGIAQERPPRQQRPERQARPAMQSEKPREQKPNNKSTDNGYQRAKALASKLGISVVIPLYNEQDSLRELTASVREELFALCEKQYEVIFINDGSTDRSAQILKDVSAASSRVSVLTFRSNLGKSAALSVGFAEAQYGIVITMDADLQDDPKEFVNLIAKLDEGFDLVTGWKKKRNDPIGKTLPSKLFNSVTSFFSGLSLHDFNCGLKAYRKAVTDSLDVYGEMHRYLPALAHWQGFKVAEIPVLHHPRKFGKSKFGTSRFFKGFLDLLTILFTNRYSRRPLHLFGTVGTLLALLGFGINVFVSIEWLRGLTTLSNRPILWLGILLILVGVQLISIGLLGEMMVKNAAKSSQIPFDKERRKPRPRPTNDRRNPA